MRVRKLQPIGGSVGVTLPIDELEKHLGSDPLEHLEENEEYVHVEPTDEGFEVKKL